MKLSIKDLWIGRRGELGNVQQVHGSRLSGPIIQLVRFIKDGRLGRQGQLCHVPTPSTSTRPVVRGCGQPGGSGGSTEGFEHGNEADLRYDEYAHELLDKYYDEVGPKRLRFAVRFFVGPDGCVRRVLHGLWPEPRVVLTSGQMQRDEKLKDDALRFEKTFAMYEDLILAHWPDTRNPTCLDAAKRSINREWKKHGKPAGIPRTMYLLHGLALVLAIPDNFNIPVDMPMSLNEVGQRAQDVVRDLHVFGNHIGADVMPEIVANMNPKNPSGHFVLNEIRVHLERTVKENRAVYKVVAVDGGKCFTGKANSGNNMVLLPSSLSS